MFVLLDESGAVERYPYSVTDLRIDQNLVFGAEPSADALAGYRLFPVAPAEPPAVSMIEVLVHADPVEIDGEWVQQWAVEALPIDDAKVALWSRAKGLRDQGIDAGVAVAGLGIFDSDAAARGNITGAVTMALVAQMTGQPFTIDWKLADNSVAVLNGAQMIGVGVAIGQHVAACHAVAQQLGLAIQAAEDHAALAAIDVEAGWP